MQIINFEKAIPVYNDIKALQITIQSILNVTKTTPKNELNKVYLTFKDGNQLDLNNFDANITEILIGAIILFKENQLKQLKEKFDSL